MAGTNISRYSGDAIPALLLPFQTVTADGSPIAVTIADFDWSVYVVQGTLHTKLEDCTARPATTEEIGAVTAAVFTGDKALFHWLSVFIAGSTDVSHHSWFTTANYRVKATRKDNLNYILTALQVPVVST
jgi:hypothetical protein